MCGIPAKIGKLLLFTINIAVWICGAAIMGVGIALAVDDEAWDWIGLAEAGMNDDLYAAAVYIMISIGVLLFLVGFLGCCGVCKGNTCMLQTYIILVSILLALELVGGILAIVFKDSLEESLRRDWREDIQTKYAGVNDTSEGFSVTFNSMQMELQCCGSYNYTDYEGSNWASSNPDPVPITCCMGTRKVEAGYYSISATDKLTCMDEARADNQNPTQLYRKGCYDGLWDWVQKQSDIVIGVLIGLGAVQLFGLIGACCVKSSLEEEMA